MIPLVFLTNEFYEDYAHCAEILTKVDRPHVQATINHNGYLFCIPLRSQINHNNAIFTDKANRCGIDFSKVVVITNQDRYLDKIRTPHIRPTEFKVLKEINPHQIETGLVKYIARYKKAKSKLDVPRNSNFVQCSSLQYFEEYI